MAIIRQTMNCCLLTYYPPQVILYHFENAKAKTTVTSACKEPASLQLRSVKKLAPGTLQLNI
jgi:hypothetical protein